MSQLDAETRRQARDLLIQSNVYRTLAAVFAFVGLVVFIVLYFNKVDGNLVEAFRQPLLIVSMIIPFLPAVVLSRKAEKMRKKVMELMGRPGGGEGTDAAK